MLAASHPPDRDAGGLGVVPAPPPRGASFTSGITVHPEPMSASSVGRLSRASSSQSVGSSVPRSSSFTRSRKFARGDVLSLEDAHHILDSSATTYAGSLKFAAAQQILAEHLPSPPERGADRELPPPPPVMPTNDLAPPVNLRQPGPLPKRMPIPLIKSKPKSQKRPVTPPPKVEKGGTFNILVPAAAHTAVEADDSSPEEKKKGRAFGRVFSRAMSNKVTNSASAASLPDLPLSTPQPTVEKEKPKKVLRFDDRSTDICINLEPTPKSTAPTSAQPAVDGGFDRLRARASLPTFATAPSRSADNVEATSGRRLLRARTFFGNSRSSARAAPADPAEPSTSKVEPLDNDEPERLAPKPRVARGLGANSAAAPRLSFVPPFAQKRAAVGVAANASGASGEAVKPQRFDSTTTAAQLPRSASAKFLSFFGEARATRAASVRVSGDNVDASNPSATAAAEVGTTERKDRPVKMVVVSKPSTEADATKPVGKESEDRAVDPTVAPETGTLARASSIRRFLRTSSKNDPAKMVGASNPSAETDAAKAVGKESEDRVVEPSAAPEAGGLAPTSSFRRFLRSSKNDAAKMVAVSNPSTEADVAKAVRTESEDRVAEPTAVPETGSLTPASSIRRLLRTSSKNDAAASFSKQKVEGAASEANTANSPKEPSAIQKSIAKAQAASASFVARAKKLPRSATITRMQNTFSRNSSVSNVAVASTPVTASAEATRENSEVEVAPVRDDDKVTGGMEKRVEDEGKSGTKKIVAEVDKIVEKKKKADSAVEEAKNSSKIDLDMITPNKTSINKESEVTVQVPSPRKDRKAENDAIEAVAAKDLVPMTPLTEERAVSDFGATTKDLPEFVTIKRVIRRKKPDGTEEVITKRIRERPSAVRPNGDVVVQRTVRRLKKDGSGEKETVVIEKIIPRRSQGSTQKADRPAAALAAEASRQSIVASHSGPVQSAAESGKDDPALKTSSSTSKVDESSRNNVTAAVAAWNKATSRSGPELRDEDWPIRYKSLKETKRSSSADNVVKEEMKQVEKLVQVEMPPSSFGMIQQGLPRGSSFHGQEPYEHPKKERLVRLPGAQTYTNLSVVPVESSGRQPLVGQSSSFTGKSGKGKKGTFRKSTGVERDGVAAGGEGKASSSNDDAASRPERGQRRWPKMASTGSSHRRASLTRVLSLDSSRRSQSDFDRIHDEVPAGTSPNNRPGRLPKSSSVGDSPARRAQQAGSERFKVRSKFAGMLSSLRNRFQGAPSAAAA